MDNFLIIMDDLALVDVKPDKGWFTWTNNREGNRELRDRLGRFLVLASWLGRVPFFSSSVLRQTCSDHDAVLLDTLGRKLREEMRDPRLSFSKWQFQWFKKGQDHMRRLIDRIHKHMDGPMMESNVERLCASQARLGCFYEEGEERQLCVRQGAHKAFNEVDPGKAPCKAPSDGMTARFKVDRWGFEGLDGNSLWTSSNGSRDGLGSKQVCHRGGLRNETIIHALRDCPEAQEILSFGGLDGCLLNYPYESCIDWLEDATHLLDLKAFENLITVLWNVWNGRNNALFWGKEDVARLVWEHPRFHRWIKPSNDAIKINVDVAVLDSMVGIGIIAEAEALREGIIWARNNNVTRAFLDTDCA
ncbi:hypothetical protein Gorai_007927, partial [Gossypium raimondii]|nr:hypothetical protein [Gossypium raimondii]